MVVGVFVLVLVAAEVLLDVASRQVSQGYLVVPFGIVGFIIARRQPRNPIGWLLLVITLTLMLADDGGSYALLKFGHGHPGLPLGRIAVFLAAGWIAGSTAGATTPRQWWPSSRLGCATASNWKLSAPTSSTS
jgi:hypothetical protein